MIFIHMKYYSTFLICHFIYSLWINFNYQVAFREFKYLALCDYPELKDLWYGQLDHNAFCNLKHGLEELEVRNCYSLEVVFDVRVVKLKEIGIKRKFQLKNLTLSWLPNLKHIWNEDPYEIINFENLRKVNVSMRQSLSYIFPYSLCQDLQLLQMLEIDSCGVEGIIAMEERSMESNFCFPQLNKLIY